ncbi:MAG: hypothetical protein WC393_03605 [Candidatus Nanoarchaeia archaeon]|jgi:hypothetical protein
MIAKFRENFNVLKLTRTIENLQDYVLKDFFEKLSESFNNHISIYKKNTELYSLGLKVVDSIKYLPKCFYCSEKKKLDEVRIMGYTITGFAEKLCTLDYKKISEILDYLRSPLTNYLDMPSKLLIEMWDKTKNLKDLEGLLA